MDTTPAAPLKLGDTKRIRVDLNTNREQNDIDRAGHAVPGAIANQTLGEVLIEQRALGWTALPVAYVVAPFYANVVELWFEFTGVPKPKPVEG